MIAIGFLEIHFEGRYLGGARSQYHGNRRREVVDFTENLRSATKQAIKNAHETVTGKMPLPIKNAKKCRDCSLKTICLPKEVKKLVKF